MTKKTKSTEKPPGVPLGTKKRGRPRAPAQTEFGRWMDRNDLSAEDLAGVGECSQTSINTMRRGAQLPSLTVAKRLIVYSRAIEDPIDVLAFFSRK